MFVSQWGEIDKKYGNEALQSSGSKHFNRMGFASPRRIHKSRCPAANLEEITHASVKPDTLSRGRVMCR